MASKDEDLALVSLLSAHAADCLPYLRRKTFLDQFPTRRSAAKWVFDFWESSGTMPKLALLKKHFPAVVTLQQAEPLPYVFGLLKDQYIETVTANAGNEMTESMEKKDYAEFIKNSQKLIDMVEEAERPLGATADDSDNFVEQIGARMDQNSALALKVMPTLFGPFDEEDGGGLRPGHLYVVASLVNLGKTYVSLQMAENIRAAGYRVLYVSTEMPKEDLLKRALAVRYHLDVNQFIKMVQPKKSLDAGESKADWYKGFLQTVQNKIDADTTTGKLFIRGSDEGVLVPRQIKSDVKELGIDAVFIDAAQDIRDDRGSKERVQALYNALAEINSLANACHVSVLMTVQLDPEVEKKGLTQGNLNRVQWAQAFAQKCHIQMSMLGQRDADFRDMSIDKGRDGGAGRKFWLTFKFPEVCITATAKPPGTLQDLDDSAKPVSSIADLDSALSSLSAPLPTSTPAQPPAVSAPPPAARKVPVRVGSKPPPAIAVPEPASEGQKSPYQIRQEHKQSKKGLNRFKGGKK